MRRIGMRRNLLIRPKLSPQEVGNRDLRETIDSVFHDQNSKLLVAYYDHTEVGLLFLECNEYESVLFIQRIFVLPEFRRIGIGTALLGYAEDYAIRKLYLSIMLNPRPLDSSVSEEQLMEWYGRHGFEKLDDEVSNYMEKCWRSK